MAIGCQPDVENDAAAPTRAFHFESDGQVPGPDPQRSDYASFLAFSDPDGNGWLVQEVRRAEPRTG